MVELEKVINSSAKGSMYLFLGRLISEILNAAGAVYVGRTLAADQYGILSLYYLVPWTFELFTDLGLNVAATRIFAYNSTRNQYEPIKKVLKTVFITKIAISVIVSCSVIIYSDNLAGILLNRPELGYVVRFSAVLIIAQTVFSILQSMCAGLDRMDIMALMGVLMSAFKAGISIYLVNEGYGAQGGFTGHLLGTGIVGIITLIIIVRYIYAQNSTSIFENELYESSLYGMLKYGFPLYLGSLIAGLGERYNGYLLALFSTNIELGNIDVSKKFVSLLALFTTPISSVTFPAFSKYNIHKEKEEIKPLYQFSIRYATLLVIPAMVAIILFADPGINLLYEYKYTDAPFFLQLILLQYITVGMGSLSMTALLNSQGKTTTTFRITIINTIISVAISYIMISTFGITGYFMGIVLSKIIGTVITSYVTRKSFNIGVNYGHSFRVILFSSTSALITYMIMSVTHFDNLFIHLVVGTLLYILLCVVLAPLSGGITDRDISNIRMLTKNNSRFCRYVEPILILFEKLVNILGRGS